jgi:site-specific DNA-methyltransferase (cytosine-N4-specific)
MESELPETGVAPEEWSCAASNHAQRYATHGLFRFFGKAPPYVARQLLADFTKPGDTVLDPMAGSGTMAVEALLLGRNCLASDVNPFAALVTRCKTTPVHAGRAQDLLGRLVRRARQALGPPGSGSLRLPEGVNVGHWFLPETCTALAVLRDELRVLPACPESELLTLAYAGIIRRVSRATTEQGRLFLDATTAEADPLPRFEAAARQAVAACAELPETGAAVSVRCGPARSLALRGRFPLIFCHPPYFNGYKYSSVLSLEMTWLDLPRGPVGQEEVREFFKVGKPENAGHYVADLAGTLQHLARFLSPSGTLALMAGDARLGGRRIPVVRRVLDAVRGVLTPRRIVVRTPQFTEASWAASQRRTGAAVGVTMTDFLVLLGRP